MLYRYFQSMIKGWVAVGGRSVVISAVLLPFFASTASGTDVDLGEYESMPAGTNVFVAYYKAFRHDAFYNNGARVSDNAQLDIDVAILRYVGFREWGERLIALEAILPVATYRTAGDFSALGDVAGIGDLIVPLPVFLMNKPAERKYFAVSPVLHVPIGEYDKEKPLNIGENRWKYEFQAGYVTAISNNWNLDATLGVTFFGDNTAFGPESLTLEQRPELKGQFHATYLGPNNSRYGLGLVHTAGGETKIAGVDQRNQKSTTRLALSYARMLTPKDQILLSVGRDMSVDNGSKEEGRLTLRFMHLY